MRIGLDQSPESPYKNRTILVYVNTYAVDTYDARKTVHKFVDEVIARVASVTNVN